MKALIKIVSIALVAAWIPNLAADNGVTARAQPSAALTWNRIALDAVERAKPTQHQAIRLLAHVSLAQHAALGNEQARAVSQDAIAAASMRVIAELLPSQATFVEERHRQLQSGASEQGQRVAQHALAHARSDGFAMPWNGNAPQAAYSAYWVPRPSQADPSIKPLIGVPNHPSYPSNHACVSTAAALVLAHFFPQARADLEAIAAEAGLSRIYAGLHFRFDVDAGESIGRNVAAAAIARYPEMLAKWTRPESIAQQAH